MSRLIELFDLTDSPLSTPNVTQIEPASDSEKCESDTDDIIDDFKSNFIYKKIDSTFDETMFMDGGDETDEENFTYKQEYKILDSSPSSDIEDDIQKLTTTHDSVQESKDDTAHEKANNDFVSQVQDEKIDAYVSTPEKLYTFRSMVFGNFGEAMRKDKNDMGSPEQIEAFQSSVKSEIKPSESIPKEKHGVITELPNDIVSKSCTEYITIDVDSEDIEGF